MTARVWWRHPRTNAMAQFTGKVVNRHRSGRVTVEIVVDGRTYVVTADEVTE